MQDRRDIMFQDQKSREDLELDQFNKHNSFVPEERPLTKAQIRGWLAYAVAAEPYSVVCISALAPLVLESLASNYGYETSDHSLKCDMNNPNYSCVVHLGGLWLDTASFSLYCVSVSVFLQAFVFISMGALADHGTRRKTFMLMFSLIGSVATALFAAITSPRFYWLAGILVIISNVAFGASWVFYYAFIPTLARDHPDVIEVRQNVGRGLETWADYQFVKDRVSNTLSSHSMAIGYGAGVFLLVVAAGVALAMNQTTYSMQLGMAISGVWWFCVMFYTWKNLLPQPGLPLKNNTNLFLYSWRRLGKTLHQASMLKETFKYLIAWFILSDGSSTIITLAMFMGKKNFLFGNTLLMVGAIVVPVAALIGTYIWLFIQRTFHLTSKQVLIIISCLYVLVPVYVLIGFSGKIGLVHEWEVWMVLPYFGLMLGSSQSYSRVLYASLIPRGKESEFFSLYGITDKSSSWLGPLITGAIISNHDTRWGFIFPLVMMFIPIFIISWVKVEKGINDAERFGEEHTDDRDGL
ncbi:MFS transporter, UMF1 family [Entomortierella parvispora]|uniref:Autophagy-related protein n=1 Tax=Entomortierella parvispora TaxID=205924 RepID=A0A9P3HEV8_9FUNG|nr:MFS transporter, UMF1 family [Entomortierella parvispora]